MTFLRQIRRDYEAKDYDLFTRNCRNYTIELMDFLNPDAATEGRRYIRSLLSNQASKGTLLTGLGGLLAVGAATAAVVVGLAALGGPGDDEDDDKTERRRQNNRYLDA